METENQRMVIDLSVGPHDRPWLILREIERVLKQGKVAEDKALQDALITLHIWLQESLEAEGEPQYLEIPAFITYATDKPKPGLVARFFDWCGEKVRKLSGRDY